MRALTFYRMVAADWAALGGAMVLATTAVLFGHFLP